MARFRYRRAWEHEFPGTAGGRAAFDRVAGRIADETARELRATVLPMRLLYCCGRF